LREERGGGDPVHGCLRGEKRRIKGRIYRGFTEKSRKEQKRAETNAETSLKTSSRINLKHGEFSMKLRKEENKLACVSEKRGE